MDAKSRDAPLGNRRFHVKGYRSAQRDFRKAEYGRTAQDGNRRMLQEAQKTTGQFLKRTAISALGIIKVESTRSEKRRRDSWTALSMGDNPENDEPRCTVFYPGAHVTQASKASQTDRDSKTQPCRNRKDIVAVITLIMQLDRGLRRVSTFRSHSRTIQSAATTHRKLVFAWLQTVKHFNTKRSRTPYSHCMGRLRTPQGDINRSPTLVGGV